MPGYSSGQRGVTVNHLAFAFGSSNLSPGTSNHSSDHATGRFFDKLYGMDLVEQFNERRLIVVVSVAVIVGVILGGVAIGLIVHSKPGSSVLSRVSGFTPFVPKAGAQSDFKMVQSSLHYSQGVLLFSLQNPVGASVAVTEQKLPDGYNAAQLATGSPVSTEYGQAFITDTPGQTVGTLVSSNKTWVLLNAPTPIGTDAMQQVIESLSPR